MRIGRSLLACAAAAMLLAGCGSEKKDEYTVAYESFEDGAANAANIKNDNIYDTLEAVGSFTEGSYSLLGTISVDDKKEDVDDELSFKLSGETNGLDFTFGMELDGSGVSVELDDLLIKKGGRLYINAGDIIDIIAGEDEKSDIGYYGLLLPDVGYDEKQDYSSKIVKLYDGAIEAVLSGAKIDGGDGKYQAHFTETEEYRKSITNFSEWLDENSDELGAMYEESLEIVDYEDYYTRLFDEIGDDLIGAAKLLGFDSIINEDSVAAAREEMLSEEYLEMVKESSKAASFVEMVSDFTDSIDDIGDEKINRFFDAYETKDLSLLVELTEEGFKIGVVLDFLSYDNEHVYADLSYVFSEARVDIDAPEQLAGLTELAGIIKEKGMLGAYDIAAETEEEITE